MSEQGRPGAYDRVRQTEIKLKDFELKHVEEAFTSEHWIGEGFGGGGLSGGADGAGGAQQERDCPNQPRTTQPPPSFSSSHL
jgi:hypothetical protein